MKIIFMGTGNAFGHNGSLPSCYLLEYEYTVLLDCGPSIFPALKSNNKSINDIDAIFISHLHPDHILGIPQLALENFYVIKRDRKIKVYSPIGTRDVIIDLTRAMYDEPILTHIDELFQFIEFPENEILEIPGGNVKTLPALHSGNARMQIITVGDKSIGYTGDTAYIKESFDELLRSDIVITEASSSGFSIPDHMTLEQVQKLDIPANCRVFLSHLGQSVIDKKEEIVSPIFLSHDNMMIEF